MHAPLPSLNGLRAFEATARRGSVTLAAQELNVTPGAVSLQVRELEMSLGISLFTRKPRRLILTQDGEKYFAALRTAFRTIREATAQLKTRALPILTISCTPSFAIQWLTPRLSLFEALHPQVDLRISPSNRIVDLERDGIDVAIRHGFGTYPGLESERLIDDDLTPVCSPVLLTGADRDPALLENFTLLHDEHRHDWRLWLEAAGLDTIDASNGPIFLDSNGAIETAKAGHGFALVRRSLVARELEDGVLVAPFCQEVAKSFAYHLVYPATALERPIVAAFRDWVLSQAKK